MTITPDRLVLEGVPRVHFYEGGPACPEDIPFPSARDKDAQAVEHIVRALARSLTAG